MDNHDTSEFRIKNFRSLESVSVSLDKIGILVGRNNSGKSNIMLAINKSINEEDFTDEDFLDINLPIEVNILYKGKKYFGSVKAGSKRLKWKEGNPPIELIYLKAIPDYDDATSSVGTKLYGKLLSLKKTISLYTNTDINNLINDLRDKISDNENQLFFIIKDQIVESLNRCDNDISDIKYQCLEITIKDFLKNRILFVKDSLGKEFEWKNMGHGTRRLILMLYYAQLAKCINESQDDTDIIICIEEPEIFLHPQQQRAVASELYEKFASAASNFKLLVSTHSPFFIDEKHLNNLRLVRKEKGITRIHNDGKPIDHLDIDKCHMFREKEVGNEDILNKLRTEPDLKEIFFSEKVLLVEGYNEKTGIIRLFEIIKKRYLNSENITIINAGANTSIFAFAKILYDFNIPFVIAMDRDKNGKNPQHTNMQIDKITEWMQSKGIQTDKRLVTIENDFCSELGCVTNDEKSNYNFTKTIYNIKLHEINDQILKYIDDINVKIDEL